MGKLSEDRGDGADPSVPKKGKDREVYNAVHMLTKSAKGGAFLRDISREMCKLSAGTDEDVVIPNSSISNRVFDLCRKGVMKRELRPDRFMRKRKPRWARCMSYFYYISKAEKGPQIGKKAGPPKATTSQGQGLRRNSRDQAYPAQRQKDPGPSTSLRRANGGKPGKAGCVGTSSGSGSGQERPTMKPLIPRLSQRVVDRISGRRRLAPGGLGVADRIAGRRRLAPGALRAADRISGRRGLAPGALRAAGRRGSAPGPGGSGANYNQRSVSPDPASDTESDPDSVESGSAAQLDRPKQSRGYGKKPAGRPAATFIHSGRGGTSATAAPQSRSGDTSQTGPNHNGTQYGGEQLELDEGETAEIARALQPLSPLGDILATLQREHASSAALEVEIASIAAECTDAKTAVECAQGEKEKILEVIKDSTESVDTLPQFTGVQLSLAAYEETICDFRDTHAEARRLESELASLRKRETAKKAALESELKKLETEIESQKCRLQEEMDAVEESTRELPNCSMTSDSEKFGTVLHHVQKKWEIVKKTRDVISLKENELTAAKTQAETTANTLATGIFTAEAELAAAVSLYRELLAQLLTFRAGSQESAGDPRVSTGAPTPGQSYGTPSQHEKLANDLFLQHEMETKAAKAAEALGKNLQEKRKAIAAAEEKFANTLERVKMKLGDLPRPPVSSLGTVAMEERSRILRLMIAQEKAMTAVHLELYRLPTQLDEQKKANEKVIQETKGRVDAQRMKVQEAGNQMRKLTADLCSSGDEDRSREIGDQLRGQTTTLLEAKTDLAAAEAELKAAGRDGEMAANRTQRKIGDMESAFDTDRTRLCELVARLYAGTKSAGIGNPGCAQPVAGDRTGSPRDGTGMVGPDAGGFPVGCANLEEDAGNVGTDAGRDPAGTPSGNTQDGTGEVGSDAEMEQVETPTRDGSMEPVTPGSVGLRSEGSLTPSPRGGRDNHEQADSSSTEDPDVGALMPYYNYASTYNYAPNYDYSDEGEYDFFALLPQDPQDLMEEPAEEDGGPSCSGLGDRSPSTGIGCLDADAGSSTAGYSGLSSASLDPQDDPEEMDTE